MAQVNTGRIVAAAWIAVQEETESPFRPRWGDWWVGYSGSSMTYRAWLDRQPLNWHGQPIPRRVTLRRNLDALGPVRLDPGRLR